jgi:hypothetical protein
MCHLAVFSMEFAEVPNRLLASAVVELVLRFTKRQMVIQKLDTDYSA